MDAAVVIIGAGIVGCSTAYELAKKGWRNITVIDQGPLFATGGSTSHAPGLVFQTNSSKTMCALARASVETYMDLISPAGERCFLQVGSIEVAYTPERLHDLQRKLGLARSWGLEATIISATEAAAMVPLLNSETIHGAYYVPTDGLAKAVWACEAMGRAAQERGVRFQGNTPITGFAISGGRVRGVETASGTVPAEIVLVCAGIWGPKIGRLAGISIPLTPCQHQYVRTAPLPQLRGAVGEATHPIIRHQDKAMYMRQHGESYGVGSYQHEPILTAAEAIRPPDADALMPSVMPFTPEHFAQPWRDAVELLPALEGAAIVDRMNGMFSFTPDGLSVLGPSPEVAGLWVAEAVWVTHGPGVGRVMADWLSDGLPPIDLRECHISRFEQFAHSEAYITTRGAQQYREVYDIIHPRQSLEQPRGLRTSPFYEQQRALGAAFFEARGWERPQWYEANAPLAAGLTLPERDAWSATLWSPSAVAEHLATRERVALYDMTPLPRYELSGPGALALLERLTTSKMDKAIGKLSYTLLLDERGGIRSDITVARLAADRFQLGCNGLLDEAYLRSELPADGSATLHDLASSFCCIGLWGPRARDLLQLLCQQSLGNEAFPYLSCHQFFVGEVPVRALRVSYVGELGWELYAPSEYGRYLWNLLWDAGQAHGIVAGGRAAFDALRLEKGYRLWGNDMDAERTPEEAGLGFVINMEKGPFVGREALQARSEHAPVRRLCCLVLDDPGIVLLGKEPLLVGDAVAGYVTSAAYGASVGASIAYGYLPAASAVPGTAVAVEYFGQRYPATVSNEPLFDPKGTRLRS